MSRTSRENFLGQRFRVLLGIFVARDGRISRSIAVVHNVSDNCAIDNTPFHFTLVAALATMPNSFNLREDGRPCSGDSRPETYRQRVEMGDYERNSTNRRTATDSR
jgi:hypothetical protein